MRRSPGTLIVALVLVALSEAGGRAQQPLSEGELSLMAQVGHTRPVTCVAISPDESVVATGAADRTLKLWHAPTGKVLRSLPHGGTLTAVAFAGPKTVLTTSQDGKLRWWDVNTGRDRTPEALPGADPIDKPVQLHALAVSPDGRTAVTGGREGRVAVWDVDQRKKLKEWGHAPAEAIDKWQEQVYVPAVAFHPDGKLFATATAEVGSVAGAGKLKHVVRVWDVATHKQQAEFVHGGPVTSLSYRAGGTQLAVGGPAAVTVYDLPKFEKKHTFAVRTATGARARFSPDGKTLAAHPAEGPLQFWDAVTGAELPKFTIGARNAGPPVTAFAFAASSKAVACGFGRDDFGPDGQFVVQRFDLATMKAGSPWFGKQQMLQGVAISPDGKTLAVGDEYGTVVGWDLVNGQRAWTAQVPDSGLLAVETASLAFTPDNRSLVVRRANAPPGPWTFIVDAETGKLRRAVGPKSGRLVVTPDAARYAHAVKAGDKITVRVNESAGDKEVWAVTFEATTEAVPLGFTPDGARLLVAVGTVIGVYDAATGARKATIKPPEELSRPSVAFHPNGTTVALFHTGGLRRVEVYEVATGKGVASVKLPEPAANTRVPLKLVTGARPGFRAVAFHPTQPLLAVGGGGRAVQTFRTNIAAEQKTAWGEILGHAGTVTGLTYSADGKWLFTAGEDGLLRIHRATASGGAHVATMLPTDKGWAVGDPQGRYDAANGGDVDGLHWVLGTEPIALVQLKSRYFEPHLLAKVLGNSKEAVRPAVPVEDAALFPLVTLDRGADAQKLVVRLTCRGGGVGPVVVRVNGKELIDDARPRKALDVNAPKLDIDLDFKNDPRLIKGKPNKVEVIAYNANGSLASRALVALVEPDGEAATDPPNLWAVVVGTSDYSGLKLDLRYAAKDARDFADALRVGGHELFVNRLKGKASVTLLTTDAPEATAKPTRANVLAALAALKNAKTDDVVVIYLAGHGVSTSGAASDFYYLTMEMGAEGVNDEAVLKARGVSGDELVAALKTCPANKQVLILDTCASGRAVEKFTFTDKRNVPDDQVRALERVKDRTGMYVLAGCAADAVSYEATRYRQGLLTYSLLFGMSTGEGLKDGDVDISALFGFAADRVPDLARNIGGVQRPVVAAPRGGRPFAIGTLTAAGRTKIPFKSESPLVLRCNLQDEDESDDVLGLMPLVDDQFRTRGRGDTGVVFVDAVGLPEAYRLGGRYKVDGTTVTLTANLFRDKQKVGQIKVTGTKDKLADLAAQVAVAVEKELSAKK